jgi:hypothetical protein
MNDSLPPRTAGAESVIVGTATLGVPAGGPHR